MSEKDYSPLSASCVRGLNDKLYEKRKVSALEIERTVKELMLVNNTSQIQRLIRVLGQEFALSMNPNSRKGGLIGLAAMAIALGKESSNYVTDLVRPVLSCFFDSDSRVRYYGCESLYNIVKVARSSVLPFFNEIFDGLSKLSTDPDQDVRKGSEVLDRLMKDIVTESCAFDMVSFMPLLRERIYAKNSFARQFIVSWISALDAVPDINFIIFLPEILDGLFEIMGDRNPEIRKGCEALLGQFLKGIKSSPTVDYSSMVNILTTHCQSTDATIQFMAISWLREFVQNSQRAILPYASGIIMAVLPCLSYDVDSRKNIQDIAKTTNTSLMRLINSSDDKQPSTDSSGAVTENDEDKQGPKSISDCILPMVEVLTKQLIHDSMQTKIASLRWIYTLHIKTPNMIFQHVDETFPLLLKTLSDPSDEVVLLDLEVLAEISSNPVGQKFYPQAQCLTPLPDHVRKAVESSHSMNEYFTKFMVSLLNMFSTDQSLLEDRGSFIIRQLCLLLNAEDIYRCCSQILLHEEDMKFASHMIQSLSTILLTSTELFELRQQLKSLKTQESCTLFCCLYKSWCHNPIATVALCLLTQNYKHASELLTMFGDLEVTVEFLTEIDKLVQLLESPIFTYLRLQLLDTSNNHYLIQSLYSMLMLLPQSNAFRTLKHRLDCVPNIQAGSVSSSGKSRKPSVDIDFEGLKEHFWTTQEKHRGGRRKPHSFKVDQTQESNSHEPT